MSAPLTIRFATDHAGAKAGIQDLAASVVSNMVKVSDSLGIAANANGGYLNSVRTLATNVASDFGKVGAAGIKAANDSNGSMLATTAAMAKAATETKTATSIMAGAHAVAAESGKNAYGIIRDEVTATGKLLSDSKTFGPPMKAGTSAAAFAASEFATLKTAGAAAARQADADARSIGSAIARATGDTQTGEAAKAAFGTASTAAQAYYATLRAEAAETARAIASSPTFVGAAVGVAGAVAAFVTVTAAVKQANAQIERFIKLGDEAQAAGVSAEFWQRFSDGAKKAKIEIAEIEAALKTAAKAVTPKFEEKDQVKARLEEIFESGYAGSYESKGLADYRSATDNEGRIRAMITAMQEMKTLGMELERLDVGSRMFGPDFADRIRTGKVLVDELVAGLDRPRDDLIKDEEIRRAEEFRDRLNAAYKEIDDFLHVSTMLESSGRAVLDLWLGIAEAVAKGTANAANFYTKIQDMQDGLSKLLNLPIRLGNAFETIGLVASGSAKILTEGVQDKINGTPKLYDKPIGPELPSPAPNAITDPPAPPRRALDLYLNPPTKREAKTGGAKSGGAESLDSVETFIHGLEKTAAATKAEAEAFGKSNAEKAVAINLAKLKETADQKGITLTEAQTAKVTAASEATARYKDTLLDLEQAERQVADASRFLWGGIADNMADAILNGKGFLSIVSDLGKMTFRSGLQALFTGQGPMAGILGTAAKASAGGNAVGGIAGMASSVFGGFRANGGPVEVGKGYSVNEISKELFYPEQNGTIVPASQIGRGGGGGSLKVSIGGTTIDARYAQPGMEARLAQVMAQRDAELQRQFGQLFDEWKFNN